MAIAYNCNYDGTMPFSDVCIQVNCATGVAQTYTVPGGPTTQYQALFEYNQSSNVFIRLNGVPTTPAAGTQSTQQYSEFRPHKRYVKGGDVIQFITPDANAYIGVSLRQLQG